MKSTLLLIVFSTFVYPAAAGTCQYPNATTVPNLSAGFTTPIISGTKSEGFFIKCVYDVTYELNLWRIEKFSNGAFEIVFTYFKTAVPPEQPGGNYVSRNITLVSKNTIVFPDMTPDDIGDVEYKCTVQFVTPAITCIESTKVWVIAKPVIIWILPTRVKSDSLPVGQEIHVTVAGRDFLTKGSVENIIVTEEAVNNTLITTITDQSDGFKNFTSEEISISTPETSNTEFYIPVYMNTDNISIIVDEGNFKTETTPDHKKVCNYSTGFLAAEVIMALVKIGLDVLVWKQKAPRWSIYVAAPIIVIISCVSVGLHFGSCSPLNELENEGVAVAAVVIAFLSIVFALINLIFCCCCKKEEKLKVEESGAALKEVPKRNNPDKPDLEKGTSLSDVKVTNEEGKPKETPDMNKTDEDQKDMKRL